MTHPAHGGEDPRAGPSGLPAALRIAGRIRGRHLLVLDTIGLAIAAYVALVLRYDELVGPTVVVAFLPVVLFLLAVRLVTNIRLGLYRRNWRHASTPDLVRIIGAVAVGSLATMAIFYGSSLLVGSEWLPGFPASFWIAEGILAAAVVGGMRFGIRVTSDLGTVGGPMADDSQPTLLYGAGRTGVLVARSARRTPGVRFQPVGFLDDDRDLAGTYVAGLRVYGGLDCVEAAVAATGARALLITMPSAPGSAVRPVVEAAMRLGLDVVTVPGLIDLLNGNVGPENVRKVRVEDLLRRPLVTEHAAGVEEIIAGRTVLITGAGGSIGSELARQVDAIGPARLILVDRAESPLYMVERELAARRRRSPKAGVVSVRLASVASRPAMERLIAEERPSVIFHAAAYKQVPMMETHPSDAAHVNIGGTLVLLDVAAAAGVQRFVFVSTDKAVRPSSVMGATKRIAEVLVADAAKRSGRSYVSVRFGNVLGSTGSVVPIFQEQLEKGEPLTVTDPAMTRYFMTIPEAAWLILDAAALGQDGDLFVLDMGEPVRIMDLARDLVRLAGRDPDRQPIEITGLRPGEKLHEELFYDRETVEMTASAKVLRVHTEPPPACIRADVHELLARATGEDEAGLRAALLEYARALEHGTTAEPEAEEGRRVALPIRVLEPSSVGVPGT